MRLDHIAYRVADRHKSAEFFINCFGYRIAENLPEGFKIYFKDETHAKCLVLLPPEKYTENLPWETYIYGNTPDIKQSYHLPPEIFIRWLYCKRLG